MGSRTAEQPGPTLAEGAHVVAESVAMMKASGAYVHRL
jgi:hypothetical protein